MEWGSLGRLLGVPNVWVLLMHFVGLKDRDKVVLLEYIDISLVH